MCGFDFVATSVAHPRYRRPAPHRLPQGTTPPPFARSDLIMPTAQWSGQIVGCISSWINPDSSVPALAQDSAAALRQELAWAAHLGMQAVILPTPPEPMRAFNYAHILSQASCQMGCLSCILHWV